MYLPSQWTRARTAALLGLIAIGACARVAQPGDNSDLRGTDLASSVEFDLTGGPPDLTSPPGSDLRTPPGSDLASMMAADMTSAKAADLTSPPPHDMAVVSNCVLAPQSGCPANNKCTTADTLTTVCETTGSALRGGSCQTGTANVDTCAAGGYCVTEPLSSVNLCRAFCYQDTDCGAGATCAYVISPGKKFHYCTQVCNPEWKQVTGCPAGLACRLNGAEQTDCHVVGAVAADGVCTVDSDCVAGTSCIIAGSGPGGKCRRVCIPGNGDCTTLGWGCQGVTGWNTYGVCCSNLGC